MPQLRLPARFLYRYISCVSCFQPVHAFPALDRSEQIAFAPFVVRHWAPGCLRPGIFSSGLRDATPPYPCHSTLFSRSLSLAFSAAVNETHPKLVITGLSDVFSQGPWNRCVHSFSGVCSKDVISDRNDEGWTVSSRSVRPVVDPGVGEANSLEDEAAVDGEEFFDRNIRSNPSSSSRSTLVYEAEVVTKLNSSSITSSDESDLSELGFEEGDGQFEAGDNLFEEDDTQLTASELECSALEASDGKEGTSELSELELLELSDLVSTNEDSGEGFLNVSERHEEHGGHPYLHILSVNEVHEILEKARAKDVRILRVKECCEWVDWVVFASGRSSRHLRGMADALVYMVKQKSENVGPNSFPTVEGRDGGQWMAVDCGNIVVHLFLEDARSYYNLEEFWRNRMDRGHLETFATA